MSNNYILGLLLMSILTAAGLSLYAFAGYRGDYEKMSAQDLRAHFKLAMIAGILAILVHMGFLAALVYEIFAK